MITHSISTDSDEDEDDYNDDDYDDGVVFWRGIEKASQTLILKMFGWPEKKNLKRMER